MARSKSYWKKRLEDIAQKQNIKADDYIERLEKEYKKALLSIQRDLERFYARYANAEGVDMYTAKQLLSEAEKEIWEVCLEEYKRMSMNDEFIDQIESMYSKSRISRLKSLEVQIMAHLEILYESIEDDTENLLEDTFEDTYYQTIYEIQVGTGIGNNFSIYNEEAIKKIISQPWKWGHFSQTIWNNQEILLSELEIALSQAFIRGDSIDKVIEAFSKKMRTGYSRAANVIQTEHAYIAGEATAKGYKETGIDAYEYLATLDTRTSNICRDMDSKTFKLSERIVWLNYPPLHCRCRSTTVPYFKDEERYGQRIARNYQGQVYNVPEDMTYHEWYSKHVKNNPHELLAEEKYRNRNTDKKQYEMYKKILGVEAPKSLDAFQDLKYTNSKRWEIFKDYTKARKEGHISVFSKFDDYSICKSNIERELLGIEIEGIGEIKSYSKHFIDRVLGTSKDPKTNLPRSGIKVEDVKDALVNPLKIKSEPQKKSYKIIGEIATISINPETGNLIQCNPTDSDLVRRLKNVSS